MLRNVALAAAGVIVLAAVVGGAASDAPVFEADPFWPKPLPNDWLMGQAAGVAAKGDRVGWRYGARFCGGQVQI